MEVWITKDHYDGSKSKIAAVDLDGCSMSELVFMLMSAKVAGITITKRFDIQEAVQKLNETKEDKQYG